MASVARPRRRWIASTLAPLILLVGCAPAPPPRPHVFLVVIDCLRADHVGAYGHPLPTTPHLDRLAAEGIRFESAYTNATWTKPAMATLFSGRYPSAHGLLRVGLPPSDEIETDALPEDVPMLAERLAAAGYHTVAAVNQVHLQPEFGFGRGFADYRWSLRNRSSYQLNRDLFDALSGLEPGRPVFAWLHYLDAHWPYRRGRKDAPPELARALVRPEPPDEQIGGEIERWIAEHLTEENRRALATRYDREVAFADGAVGDLVERLRAAGMLDRTLIVVTSDHGEGFFEHGELMHGFEPYDEVARVPLVFRPPPGLGLPPGVRRTLVSHVDFAATLLDLLGLESLSGSAGTSYAPMLRGEERADASVLIQTELAAALRRGPHKVILSRDGVVEAYDLRADPRERRNLAASGCVDECAGLRAELERRLRELGPPRRPRRERLTEEEAAELRALGYM